MRSAGLPAAGGEDRLLDLLDVLLEAGDRRAVVVHDAVDDRVKHGAGAAAQQVGPLLDLEPDGMEVGGLAVADRDDEPLADEDQDLAELDDLLGVRRSGPS